MSATDETVDCRGCTACCRREMILLTVDDDLSLYPEAVQMDAAKQAAAVAILKSSAGWRLPLKSNGDCINLGPSGCTIYAHRPVICRSFSCVGMARGILATLSRAERRTGLREGWIDRTVFEAGRTRLKESLRMPF